MKPVAAIGLALLILASGTAGFFLYRAVAPAPAAAVAPAGAQQLPAFAFPDLDGQVRESAEWDGQLRVVNFWASWCAPCIREIPLLIELQDEYRDRNVTVLGIAIDFEEAVKAFAEKLAFNYPVLIGQMDATELSNAVFADSPGLPFTAFVDAEGRIVRVHAGEIHREEAEAYLAEML